MYKNCYDVIRNRAGLVDLDSDGRIKVLGAGAEELLHYLSGSSISDLPEGRMINTLFADEDGSLVSTVWVVRFDSFFLVICDEEDCDRTRAHLELKCDGRDCQIEDISNTTFDIGLMGPEAEPIVAELFDDEIYTVAFQSWVELDGCWFVRYGSSGEYEIHVIGDIKERDNILNRLSQKSSEGAFETVDKKVLDVLKTEMRHLHRTPHIPDDITIYQAGIQWMLDYSKDDFCGKAALEAQKDNSAPKGVLLAIEGDNYDEILGATLSIEDKSLGKVICVYPSYSMGGCIAFAYVQDDFAYPGLSYRIADGVAATAISSPAFLTRSVLNTIN